MKDAIDGVRLRDWDRDVAAWIGFFSNLSSGFLGACVKPQTPPATPSDCPGLGTRRPFKRRVRGRSANPLRDWWTTSSNDIDNHHHSTLSARSFRNFSAAQKPGTMVTSPYPNHALVLWNKQRCAWVGTQPRATPPSRQLRGPAISWNTTYEELLSTSKPFSRPVPLPEMVDFLVDVWEQEGMYERR